jgi:hypothetical protein
LKPTIVLRLFFLIYDMPTIASEQAQVNGFVLNEDGELDFTDLEKEYQVSFEEGFDNIILVDNCPIVEEDARKQKLKAFLHRIFGSAGKIREDGIYMPMAKNKETGKTESKGYATFFVTLMQICVY